MHDGYELRRSITHIAYFKHHQQPFLATLPHVMDRKVDKEVVVRFAPLQKTLATLQVFSEERGVSPKSVCGREVH